MSRFVLASPLGGLLAASLALAAASLLAGFALDYDPWNWAIWGRELLHGTLDTRSATAWKPLPIIFTTLFALAGHVAPALWILLTRASAVLALGLGYRLAARFGGPAAGVAAVLGLVTVDRAVQWSALGNSEALLLALVFWAAETHLAGHRTSTLWLGFAAALLRPEAWPFFYAYGVLVWRHEPAARAHVIGLAAAVPLLWFVPQWIGSGDPFAGSRLALTSPDARRIAHASQPWLTVLQRARETLPHTLEWAAVLTVAWSVRRRECALALAGLAVLAWVGLVAAMAQAGYPGISRYLFAPAGVTVARRDRHRPSGAKPVAPGLASRSRPRGHGGGRPTGGRRDLAAPRAPGEDRRRHDPVRWRPGRGAASRRRHGSAPALWRALDHPARGTRPALVAWSEPWGRGPRTPRHAHGLLRGLRPPRGACA